MSASFKTVFLILQCNSLQVNVLPHLTLRFMRSVKIVECVYSLKLFNWIYKIVKTYGKYLKIFHYDNGKHLFSIG